jgi:signal transduction histidine kinase
VQLLTVLSSLTSLLINQSVAARAKAKVHTMASVGQIVAGLSHDAQSVLGSLGQHAEVLEETHPELDSNASWSIVKDDLEFIRFLVRDARARIYAGSGPLHPREVPVKSLVADVIQRCRRYFLNEKQNALLELKNCCKAEGHVYVDPQALSVAVMNCLKNALDAQLMRRPNDGPRRQQIIVTCGLDAEKKHGTINICDEAGGIPHTVLERLGKTLVSTKGVKGMGLGLSIAVNLIDRIGGTLRIATSTESSHEFPAGTVVSICVPTKASDANRPAGPPLQIISDYAGIRQRICQHLKRECDHG